MLDHTIVPATTVVMEKATSVAPLTDARTVFVPGVAPVMNFAAALPLASAITVVGVTLPPPTRTSKLTLAPDAGLFEASVTFTRTESEKLAPAMTYAGSLPTLLMNAGATLVPVESPPPHAVRIEAAKAAAGTHALIVRLGKVANRSARGGSKVLRVPEISTPVGACLPPDVI